MVPFLVIAFQPRLPVHRLPGADEPEPGVAQHHAVIAVPAAQHRPRHLGWNAADRCTRPGPARRRIAHPGLAVVLIHILDLHAPHLIGQVMVLRAGHRMWQPIQPKLLQPRHEPRQLLAAKRAKHHLRRLLRAGPRHQGQNQTGEIGVIQRLNRRISPGILLRIGRGGDQPTWFHSFAGSLPRQVCFGS